MKAKKESMPNIKSINRLTLKERLKQYKRSPFSAVLLLLTLLAAAVTVFVLLFIIAYILIKGIPCLKLDMFTTLEFNTENLSMLPAIINTVTMTLLSLLVALPIGVFSAVYLVEYAKRGSKLTSVIRITTETLSGIPSIVYGLFGYLLFVIALHWGYSLIAGVLTLAIMILPTIMRTTEEALKSVPDSFREGSFGLGAGRLRTVTKIVLPSAMPGILAGVILAVGRIVGETAALIYTSGTVAQVPDGLFGSGRTLAVHMYALMSEGLYMDAANATGVIILIVVVGINALSSFIAKKFTKGKG